MKIQQNPSQHFHLRGNAHTGSVSIKLTLADRKKLEREASGVELNWMELPQNKKGEATITLYRAVETDEQIYQTMLSVFSRR